jgi:hypothetical protein
MPNNINALPIGGPLSLQDIANAFYLYRSYADGNTAAIDSYYGDLIKYYTPSAPKIPRTVDKTINIDVFHGKRYGLPIPLVVNSPVNNYNVYDNANAYAFATYGLEINTPGVPFFITVTNNSTIASSVHTGPVMATSSALFATVGTHTWTVPAGVSKINYAVTGGGGGQGGKYVTSTGFYGGGGGGGGRLATRNGVDVSPGQVLTITVGAGGAAGADGIDGGAGGVSAIAGIIANVAGGAGGKKGTASAGGAGGAAGGDSGRAGGSAGGKGGSNAFGTSGTTLMSPYGIGGGRNAASNGAAGVVLITFATTGGPTTNTNGTAAILIGTSSNGSMTFNQFTTCELINNGTIVGRTDTTPFRTFSGGGTFTVNEGQTSINFNVAGAGGQGGIGGSKDNGTGPGGQGGIGGRIQGSMPVSQGDSVSFGVASISKNGTTYAYATNGGTGYSNWKQGENGGWAGPGTGSVSGGGGGHGAPVHDGGGWRPGPGQGGGGSAAASYQPNLAGGPAIYLTKPTTITNNGTIAGGTSTTGTAGAGYSIINKSQLVGTVTGNILGPQI